MDYRAVRIKKLTYGIVDSSGRPVGSEDFHFRFLKTRNVLGLHLFLNPGDGLKGLRVAPILPSGSFSLEPVGLHGRFGTIDLLDLSLLEEYIAPLRLGSRHGRILTPQRVKLVNDASDFLEEKIGYSGEILYNVQN